MISLQSVHHRFGNRVVIDSISVYLTEKRIAIIGANGSGKSTFLRLLNGLVIPQQGRVLINSFANANEMEKREMEKLDTQKHVHQIRKQVGFVFQNPDNQMVYPIVSEDLAFGLTNLGQTKTEIKTTVANILAEYNISHLAERYTHELSGGEKQLVAICGVLAMNPNVILFDEPTTLLDLRNKNRIEQVIASLAQTAIVVTHDLTWAASFERVICIDNGAIVADGKPAEVISQYQILMRDK